MERVLNGNAAEAGTGKGNCQFAKSLEPDMSDDVWD